MAGIGVDGLAGIEAGIGIVAHPKITTGFQTVDAFQMGQLAVGVLKLAHQLLGAVEVFQNEPTHISLSGTGNAERGAPVKRMVEDGSSEAHHVVACFVDGTVGLVGQVLVHAAQVKVLEGTEGIEATLVGIIALRTAGMLHLHQFRVDIVERCREEFPKVVEAAIAFLYIVHTPGIKPIIVIVGKHKVFEHGFTYEHGRTVAPIVTLGGTVGS